MDTFHTVLRSLNNETKGRREHLNVFREFLNHLDRASRRRVLTRPTKSTKAKAKRGKR